MKRHTRHSLDVRVWQWVLVKLRYVSLYFLVTSALARLGVGQAGRARVKRTWSLALFSLAAVTLVLLPTGTGPGATAVRVAALLVGLLRVTEVVRYATKRVLFGSRWYSTFPDDVGDTRLGLVALLQSYLEIALWFAVLYRTIAGCFHASDHVQFGLSDPVGALYFSLVTMSTLGYGDIGPTSRWAALTCGLHAALGVYLTVIVLSHIIGELLSAKERK